MRTVVITGATSGFGHLLVSAFLENGDRVIATGRRLSQRSEVFREHRTGHAGRLIEKDLDVVDAAQREQFVREARVEFPQIDILINNAGFGLFGPLEETGEAQIRQQMEVNFFALTLLTRDLLPFLRKAQGKIFNFSSVLGFTALPLTSLYCASKYAVEGLSEALSYELRPHGVQVCVIEPGGFRTNFAQNVAWSDGSSVPDSPYRIQTLSYQNLRRKLSTRPNYQDPRDVARGVLRLAARRHLPMRVAFGRDARLTWLFRRLVPESLYMAVTHFVLGRTFQKGAG